MELIGSSPAITACKKSRGSTTLAAQRVGKDVPAGADTAAITRAGATNRGAATVRASITGGGARAAASRPALAAASCSAFALAAYFSFVLLPMIRRPNTTWLTQ